MDFEKRLRDHMSEQADQIEIETASPASITQAPRTRAPITTLAALAVVIAAAAGFFALSQGDDGQVNEIAAGQADESAETSADADAPEFQVADFVPVQFTDISGENSPGYGRVFTDNGTYYVLSSAPGRVKFDELTAEEQMTLFRQDTLYVYDESAGWQVRPAGDRFIGDFQINDGVLYAISTGSKTEDTAAFGTSTDQGQTWNWDEIGGLPEVSGVSMLINEGQNPVFFANRWGFPDYQEVLNAANEAGYAVNDMTLQDFDSQGFSYIETDPNDPCSLVKARYLPEIVGFSEWRAQAPAEEQEAIEAEYEGMLDWMKEEIGRTDCEWDDAWLTDYADPEAIADLEWPAATRISWSDTNFTPPETWKPWSAVYTLDGENFVAQDLPFGDTVEVSHSFVRDDELVISVWDRSVTYDYASEEEYQQAVESGETGESLWVTTDGLEWTSEKPNYGEDYYGGYGDIYFAPKVGNQEFQVAWPEYEGEWAEDAMYDESMAVEVDESGEPVEVAATTTIAPGPDGELVMDEPMMEEYFEPAPDLERSIAGGPWETVTMAELAPDIDIGDRVLRDVRGSSLGVFLVYGPEFGPANGPEGPQGSQLMVYSNNGVDWQAHEIDADYVDFYGTDSGDGQILAFAQKWNYEENGGSQDTQTLLITATE